MSGATRFMIRTRLIGEKHQAEVIDITRCPAVVVDRSKKRRSLEDAVADAATRREKHVARVARRGIMTSIKAWRIRDEDDIRWWDSPWP